MSEATDEPRCPECGEPIGQTATYCMHCSADLTDELAAADADGDGAWDSETDSAVGSQSGTVGAAGSGKSRWSVDAAGLGGSDADHWLAPDGIVDDTLTVVAGIAIGLIVGAVSTIVLAIVTGSGWALLLGVVAWLVATAYLVRRRTVQGAVAHGGYALAIALLLVPVIALSPAVPVDGGLGERGELFVALLLFVVIPAAIAAAIGWVASRFVPDAADERLD